MVSFLGEFLNNTSQQPCLDITLRMIMLCSLNFLVHLLVPENNSIGIKINSSIVQDGKYGFHT